MKNVIIFGGSGYIGSHLAAYLLKSDLCETIYIADIEPLKNDYLIRSKRVKYNQCDVRNDIPSDLIDGEIDWIFNFAAVHREPGHEHKEYFNTNLKGARNICAFADEVNCKNILFTSSIAVYGPTTEATKEDTLKTPDSAYGSSKYAAELIQEKWQCSNPNRRLIVVRPGVVYGPGDPGNILRMIKAIQKGYFAYPGSIDIKKSYAYIYGLLESMLFFINSDEQSIKYNYVEYPTEPLGDVTKIIKRELDSKAPILSLPMPLLKPVAKVIYKLFGDRTPIHPRRVEKAAMATHIIPQVLLNHNFDFKYDFRTSLRHWKKQAPEDFL
jgi:nucleoside-diphosphate-sugar epimerase